MAIHLYRQKTGVEHRTCIGYDAVRYLKLYLESRPNIKRSDPLFTMLGNHDRMTVNSIQARFRKYARRASFLDEAKKNGYNPARPHSLRSGFRSRLTGHVDNDLIEFLMGHSIGRARATYINMPISDFRTLYADIEKYLYITKTSKDELAKSSNSGITESAFNDLTQQVAFLSGDNAKLRATLTDTANRIEALEKKMNQQLQSFEKFIELQSKT